MIRSPWDTPWETLRVAGEGLGRFGDAGIRPLRPLFADASAGGLGRAGADSSDSAGLAAVAFDFTRMGAESVFFIAGSGFAAIRFTGELPALADGLSGVAATVVLARAGVAELPGPGELVEGATTGDEAGAGTG